MLAAPCDQVEVRGSPMSLTMVKPSAKYINEIFIRPRDHATSSSLIIFDTAGATPFVRPSNVPGLLLPECSG